MDSLNVGSSMYRALHLDIDIEDEEQFFPDHSLDANATPSRSVSNSLNAGTSKSRHKSSQKQSFGMIKAGTGSSFVFDR